LANCLVNNGKLNSNAEMVIAMTLLNICSGGRVTQKILQPNQTYKSAKPARKVGKRRKGKVNIKVHDHGSLTNKIHIQTKQIQTKSQKKQDQEME
jgi:hypothetical protein